MMMRWRAKEGTCKAGFEREHAQGAMETPLTMRLGWAEVARATIGEAAATGRKAVIRKTAGGIGERRMAASRSRAAWRWRRGERRRAGGAACHDPCCFAL
jgi:hypothetical protein